MASPKNDPAVETDAPPVDTMLDVRARHVAAAAENESADPRDAGSNSALAREQAKDDGAADV